MSKAFKFQKIKQFTFWLDRTLHEGMQYEAKLFQRICTLDYDQRQQLYHQAHQLAQQGADTIITYQDRNCHLWLNLKFKSLQASVNDTEQNYFAKNLEFEMSNTEYPPLLTSVTPGRPED